MKTLLLLPFVILFFAACMDDAPNAENIELGDCVEKLKPECSCITVYEPVCGCNGITYSNSCMAECSSIMEYEPGECLNNK